MNLDGIVTVGGFRTAGLNGLIGVFVGRNIRASRDVGVPIVSNEKLANWAQNQAEKLQNLKLDDESHIECASYVQRCGGFTDEFKIAHHKDGKLKYNELVEKLKLVAKDELYLVQDAAISVNERDKKCKIKFKDNVIWVEMAYMGILQTKNIDTYIWCPNSKINEASDTNDNLEG